MAGRVDIVHETRSRLESARFKESWKYTPQKPFVDPLSDVQSGKIRIIGDDQPGIVSGPLSQNSRVAQMPLAEAGRLITGGGLALNITSDLADAVEIEFPDGVHGPVFINLGSGANATLIERGTATRFSNHSLYLSLEPGAELTHARTATHSGCCDWSHTEVRAATGSIYNLQQYFTGGARRRSETHILLEGEAARAVVTGAFIVGTDSHLDQQLVVEHRGPRTVSAQTFHGIANGKGTAVFNGRIHIHPKCPGSDAQLSNKNLALHPEAKINTKPELEIYTDDVKCAHGATVGQLSEESIFYLRSRGLDLESARRLLCRAFLTSCIQGPLAAETLGLFLAEL